MWIKVPAISVQQLRAALEAARFYVECCTEPSKDDGASKALQQIDDALAIKFPQS